jgi:aryl-alcohol dehydrogenase
MKTEALVLRRPGAPFEHCAVNVLDTLEPSECLVRIKATGICHTDLNFASKERGLAENFPAILGHEGAGIVSKVGSEVTSVTEGDHVIVTFSSCGYCKYCTTKQPSYCDLWFKYNFGFSRIDGSQTVSDTKSGKPINGHFFGQSSFARDIIVSSTALVVVPFPGPPFELLAPLGCGVMTGAGALLNILRPNPTDSVCIVGAGAVGLSAIMACKTLPKPPRRVIAVDIIPSRLELARRYGATHGVNSKYAPDLMPVLMDITKGTGVDCVLDTTAMPKLMEQIIHSTARRGKIVAVGVGALSNRVSINTFEAVQAGFTYQGSNQGDSYPQEFLPHLLRLNNEGSFPYEELIKTYAVRDVAQAVEDIKNGTAVKAVLLWD